MNMFVVLMFIYQKVDAQTYPYLTPTVSLSPSFNPSVSPSVIPSVSPNVSPTSSKPNISPTINDNKDYNYEDDDDDDIFFLKTGNYALNLIIFLFMIFCLTMCFARFAWDERTLFPSG